MDAKEVRVFFAKATAVVVLPTNADSRTIWERITGIVDDKQRECALSLWGLDKYPRFYKQTENALIISCTELF